MTHIYRMKPTGLSRQAVSVLGELARRKMTVATAESCTGGLLASLLTDQDGLGRWFERGFVTYSDEAKSEMLEIERTDIALRRREQRDSPRHGEGSAEAVEGGCRGAITGFAGPGAPSDEAGLVHLACADRAGRTITRECHFGAAGRERIRNLAAHRALEMLGEMIWQRDR